MISLFFIESVPILEPLGRQKNYRERVSDFDLGAELACRIERGIGGWFVCNGLDKEGKERVSDRILHPWSFVPDANIKFVEGSPAELRAAYGSASSQVLMVGGASSGGKMAALRAAAADAGGVIVSKGGAVEKPRAARKPKTQPAT